MKRIIDLLIERQSPEEAETYLREQGVNVEKFLERTNTRIKATFAGLSESERKIIRMRFADDPKTLAMLDEVDKSKESKA